MKKYAIVILACRDDLMRGMIKTFYYKNKMKNVDLFIAIEDRMGFTGDKIASMCKSSSNPNFRQARVIKMTKMTEDFIKTNKGMINNKFGADFLRINQKSGMQLPAIVLLQKGYDNVMMLEEDQFVVGPVAEILESDHSVIMANWGTIHHDRKSGETNFTRMDRQNGTDKISNAKMDKMGGLGRNPYTYAKSALPVLRKVYMNYINDEECFKRWIHHVNKGRKSTHREGDTIKRIPSVEKIYEYWKARYVDKAFGMPTDLWEDTTKLNQIIFYKLVTDDKYYKVFPGYGRFGPVYSLGKHGIPTKEVTRKALTAGFIIHYTYGSKKPEAAAAFIKHMDDLGYKGELSKDEFIVGRSYHWREEPQWLKRIMSKGIGAEWKDMYRNGTWLNPDYMKMIGKEVEEETE